MADPQTQTGVPDGWEVVPPAAAPPPSTGRDFKILGVNIHVPPEEKPRADANLVGWGSNGAGIAPEDALAGGMAVKGIASAAKAGGALAGARAAVAQAAPVVKYEMTKALLEHMGVPGAIAVPTAMLISGYKRGAAAEAGAGRPSDVAPAGVDRYMPNASAYGPPATPAAPTAPPPAPYEVAIAKAKAATGSASGITPPAAGRPGMTPAPAPSGPPSPAPSAPAPPAPAGPPKMEILRDQQGNIAGMVPAAAAPPSLTQEEWQALQGLVSQGYPKEQVLQAIQAKRAGAPVASAPPAAVPPPAEAVPAPAAATTSAPSAKPKLSAAEVKEVQRLKAAGKSPAEIESLIEAQRLFQQRFGLASPEATRQAVSQRNETGRWADEP